MYLFLVHALFSSLLLSYMYRCKATKYIYSGTLFKYNFTGGFPMYATLNFLSTISEWNTVIFILLH